MLEIPYRQHARVDRSNAVVSCRPHPRIDGIDGAVAGRQVSTFLVRVRVLVALLRRAGRSGRRGLVLLLRFLSLGGFVFSSLAITLCFLLPLRFFILSSLAIVLGEILGTFTVVLNIIPSVGGDTDHAEASADHDGADRDIPRCHERNTTDD